MGRDFEGTKEGSYPKHNRARQFILQTNSNNHVAIIYHSNQQGFRKPLVLSYNTGKYDQYTTRALVLTTFYLSWWSTTFLLSLSCAVSNTHSWKMIFRFLVFSNFSLKNVQSLIFFLVEFEEHHLKCNLVPWGLSHLD